MDMNKIADLRARLKAIDPEKLARKGLDFNFEDVYPDIASQYGIYAELINDEVFWEWLPAKISGIILANLSGFLTAIEKIKDYNPVKVTPPGDIRDQLAKQIPFYVDQFKENYLLYYRCYALEKKVEGLGLNDLQELRSTANGIVKELTETRKNAESTLESVQRAAADVGVTKFTEVFAKEAKRNHKAYGLWTAGTVLTVAVAIGVFVYLFREFVSLDAEDATQNIQLLVAKVFLLSFASVLVFFCSKNAYAHANLGALNRHRANSLITFETFVKSTDDRNTKDVILTQATKAIFEAGDTGFVSSRRDRLPGTDTIRILEQINTKGE